ncbi:MAG: serine hydrolase [Gemmatimonadota bacterium]
MTDERAKAAIPARRRRVGAARMPILALLPALAAAPMSGQEAGAAAPLDGLDEYVREAMEAWDVPGVALSVVKDGSVIYARGFGVRRLGEPGTVDEHTLFAIGSSSKAFTAAALGVLVDEGKLSWDDRAWRVLPDLRLHDAYTTRELTVRDLVTHRSGLPRCDLLWYGSALDRAEILRRVRHCEPESSFRSRFGYQNVMFLAAGAVVQATSGTSWDDFVEERLFAPLGMARSNTSIRALDAMENVASPHAEVEGEVTPISWRDIDNIAPAGSINSSVAEMARWVLLHLNGGEIDGRRILSDSTVAEMQTPQMVIRQEGAWRRLNPDAHFLSYGLGWFLHDYRGRKVVEHGGAIDGMRAQVGMIPEEGIGVVVLTNKDGFALGNPLMFRVFDALLGAPEKDWAAEYLAVADSIEAEGEERREKMREARVEDTRPSLALPEYAGTYADSLYGKASVAQESGGLVLRFGPFVGDLEHWHYDTFRAVWRDGSAGPEGALATFALGADGKVARVGIQGIADFRRVPEVSEEDAETPR